MFTTPPEMLPKENELAELIGAGFCSTSFGAADAKTSADRFPKRLAIGPAAVECEAKAADAARLEIQVM